MNNMRIIITIAFLSILFTSCSQDKGSVGLMDTITTDSGLKYYYVKKGDGQKVDTLSEVKAYLSLSIDGNVVWNTDQGSPDSLFTYIAGYSSLIKGFTEVSYLLRQGDEVVVIIPPQLAYGEQGAGGAIPPNATVVYDKFEVRSVTAPKGMLTDTLYAAYEAGGADAVIAKYNSIANSPDSVNYFMGNDQLTGFWKILAQQSLFEDGLKCVEVFTEENTDPELNFYKVVSLDEVGRVQEAVDHLQLMIDRDETQNQFLVNKLDELKKKL